MLLPQPYLFLITSYKVLLFESLILLGFTWTMRVSHLCLLWSHHKVPPPTMLRHLALPCLNVAMHTDSSTMVVVSATIGASDTIQVCGRAFLSQGWSRGWDQWPSLPDPDFHVGPCSQTEALSCASKIARAEARTPISPCALLPWNLLQLLVCCGMQWQLLVHVHGQIRIGLCTHSVYYDKI